MLQASQIEHDKHASSPPKTIKHTNIYIYLILEITGDKLKVGQCKHVSKSIFCKFQGKRENYKILTEVCQPFENGTNLLVLSNRVKG